MPPDPDLWCIEYFEDVEPKPWQEQWPEADRDRPRLGIRRFYKTRPTVAAVRSLTPPRYNEAHVRPVYLGEPVVVRRGRKT